MGKYKSVVDTLQDPLSIERYLYDKDTNYYAFKLSPLRNFKDKYNSIDDERLIKAYAAKNHLDKTVYKADFDNNGYTDMLLIGEIKSGWPHGGSPLNLVVLNYGGNSAKVKLLTNGLFSHYLMPKLCMKNGTPLIETSSYEDVFENGMMIKRVFSTAFTVRDSVLIEYNPAPKNYRIEKIQFVAFPCFGSCPTFEIHIDGDRNAIFLADQNNFTDEHGANSDDTAFEAKLDEGAYNEICSLLYYLDFPSLKDDYSVRYTDAPSVQLIITYNGGKQKKIEDYGLNGTFGLRQLYKIFEELRYNQKWKETTEPAGIRINTWYEKRSK